MIPRPLHRFRVLPSLPAPLESLATVAYNLHWEWDPEAIDLFRRLDPALWETSGHNPVLMLGTIDQQRLRALARDDGFLAQLERVEQRLARYMAAASREGSAAGGDLIAYFSMEFGLVESLPIYAGGLGILAGDHLKAASDLALPLIGVGLLYQEGYFRQYLSPDGWQQERYSRLDFHNLPLQPLSAPDGSPLTVGVEFPGRQVYARLWKAQVGRVPLYLLDTNVPANSEADRAITNQLYAGDKEKRIQQELILGIGGVRALAALNLAPAAFHMNEGHSAFLGLERIRSLMVERGLSYHEARILTIAGTVFTTHTPVPAGSDYFVPELIDRYLGHYYGALGISRDEFLGLGRENPFNPTESFCTTVLAFHLSSFRFGVSRLHGATSRRIWHGVWPFLPEDEVPVGHVTNGIHTPTWASLDMASLFERYLGPRWHESPASEDVWRGVADIPDEELWRTHERRRERLVAFTRRRLREQRRAAGAAAEDVAVAAEVLSPDALTIGFARRFATYKRATLLLRDSERLVRILTHPERPIQLIFAGKAHPADTPGKELMRQLVLFARRPDVRRHIVFLEDYDIVVARYLVQGVDVWLNNPRRPEEASGTSGMKAAINGALNLSVLDGWWDEAYTPDIGWAIGRGEELEDLERRDALEAEALYHLLEAQVAPLFYRRGGDRLPREWIAKVKAGLAAMAPVFSTQRMVQDYDRLGYRPAIARYASLAGDDARLARDVAAWQARIRDQWPSVRVEEVAPRTDGPIAVGSVLPVEAVVGLGGLRPDDVSVELYQGAVGENDSIAGAESEPMRWDGTATGDRYRFSGAIACDASGERGFTVRIIPRHPDHPDRFVDGLVRWARG